MNSLSREAVEEMDCDGALGSWQTFTRIPRIPVGCFPSLWGRIKKHGQQSHLLVVFRMSQLEEVSQFGGDGQPGAPQATCRDSRGCL